MRDRATPPTGGQRPYGLYPRRGVGRAALSRIMHPGTATGAVPGEGIQQEQTPACDHRYAGSSER
eukprot:15461523-Alexandrium_andersonii.AAC.1